MKLAIISICYHTVMIKSNTTPDTKKMELVFNAALIVDHV